VTDRSQRFAAFCRAQRLGHHTDRAHLAGWQRGQDTVALFLHNGTAYLEAMLGAYKARCAPVNVNYRYTPTELEYVLNDAGAAVVVCDRSLAGVLAEALPRCPSVAAVLVVDDGEGDVRIPGALDYDEVLAGATPEPPDPGCSPDDLYILYTGGTTGRPKGVLWRQADFVVGALGVRARSNDELVAAAASGSRLRVLPSPPLMHGAAHWNAWSAWLGGGTVVVQSQVRHLDPADVWLTVERERVTSLQVVGDAFARPLVDELHRHPYDLSALRFVVSGGAVLSASLKAELLRLLPHAQVLDIVGSSEGGRQGVQTTASADAARTGTFDPSAGATVLDHERTHELAPGSPEIGWLATAGRVPLGYLNDPVKTAATFPVVQGVRYSVPGDRARRLADGSIELLGRESVTINTGGEKVFAEEVELAVKHHPAVYDALVVGRPSERWGQEVVVVVQLRPGATVTLDELRDAAAHVLARYKLPRALVVRDRIARSPSGKPDYAWARAQVTGG
jgi:fatty-acyl-CoA synthase